jgi:hypothetical protein
MMLATTLYEVVLAIHIMAVVVTFGVTFAYPLLFTVIARSHPRDLPLLHRIEYTVERLLVNPGLLLVILAGIYLASKGHYWSQFFVQWGLAVAILIGGLVGAVTIPASKRAEQLAARDLAAGGAGGGTIEMSAEYRAIVRRLWVVGTLMSTLVLVTILFMVIRP